MFALAELKRGVEFRRPKDNALKFQREVGNECIFMRIVLSSVLALDSLSLFVCYVHIIT